MPSRRPPASGPGSAGGSRREPRRPGAREGNRRPRSAGGARPPGSPPRGPRTSGSSSGPGRRPSFTGRAVVLAVVLCAVLLLLVYPMRAYVDQHRRISELQARTAEHERNVAELSAEAAKYNDRGFIEEEAARRLSMVRPGEVPLRVLGKEPGTEAPEVGRDPLRYPASPPQPWFDRVVESLRQPPPLRASGS